MSKSLSALYFASLVAALAACQGKPNSSETESVKGSGAKPTICTVTGRDLGDFGDAKNAPVLLPDGKSRSWVGAGIKVELISDISAAGVERVRAKAQGGSNIGKIVTFQKIHLDCPNANNAVGSGGTAKSSGKVDPSIEEKIPWPNIYRCVVFAIASKGNAAFKGTDDTLTYVGDGYQVAVPSGEINNITVNVYVLKGGVIAAGSRGSMQSADLLCTEDTSI
jgi:hypothetical protein